MTRMLNVAILGSGKIGIDLLCKIRKSKVLSCELVAGRNLKSEGLIFARKKGFNVSNKGIDAIINKYITGYDLALDPKIIEKRLVIMIKVIGNGDYLPKFSGNLDIINAAAIKVAEHIAHNKI